MFSVSKAASVLTVIASITTGACGLCEDVSICKQDPTLMADTVFAPIEAIPLANASTPGDFDALEAAYQKSQVRLTLVRDTALRTSLSGILQQKYQQRYRHLTYLAQQAEQQRRAEAAAQAAEEIRLQLREAIRTLELGTRWGNYNAKVIQMRNSANFSVSFDLTCHRFSFYKTIFVTVPGRSSAEVGYWQGWPENFHPGDYCEAFFQGEKLWSYSISQ